MSADFYMCHSRCVCNYPPSLADCQLTGTVRGVARRPHFSLAIISATVQLWI
jgi:hypothetical protein